MKLQTELGYVSTARPEKSRHAWGWDIACDRERRQEITVGFAGSRELGGAPRKLSAGKRARSPRRACRPSCSILPKAPPWSSASRAHTLSLQVLHRSCHCRRGATRRDGATLPRDHPGDSPPALVSLARRRPPPSLGTRSQRVSRTKRTTAGPPDCSSVGNAHRDPPWLLNRSCGHVARQGTSASWVDSASKESPYFFSILGPNSRLGFVPEFFDEGSLAAWAEKRNWTRGLGRAIDWTSISVFAFVLDRWFQTSRMLNEKKITREQNMCFVLLIPIWSI